MTEKRRKVFVFLCRLMTKRVEDPVETILLPIQHPGGKSGLHTNKMVQNGIDFMGLDSKNEVAQVTDYGAENLGRYIRQKRKSPATSDV